MLYPLADLTARAERAYHDPGWAALREKDAWMALLRHGQEPIEIAPGMINRVRQTHTSSAGEKVDHGIALVTDPLGLRVEVAKVGRATKTEQARERVRAWLQSFFRYIELRSGNPIDRMVKEDVLVRSRGFVRVMPFAAAWAALDVGAGAGKGRKKLNLDDVSTPEQVYARVNEFLEDAAGIDQDEAGKEEQDAQQAVTRRRMPILVEWVPARSVWFRRDQFGIAELIEYREQTVQEVLENFLDDQGKPLAQTLNERVVRRDLLDSDIVTVLLRSDRTHMQIVVTGMPLDQSAETRLSQRRQGTDELVWEGPHGLDRVPYAYFAGRTTTSDDLQLKYRGLIDPAADLFWQLDNLVTQRASAARFAAQVGMYVKKHQDAVGTGDRTADIEIEEGGIIDATGPGESIEAIPMIHPDAFRLLDQTESQYRADIDRLTWGATAYGSANVNSGYEQALRTDAAVSATMEVFRIGLETGYADLFGLVLLVARYLYRKGLPAIPIRNVLPEGRDWEELSPDLAEADWDVSVTIMPAPVGGEMAKLNAIALREDRGYMTHADAIREAGDAYPQRVIQQRLVEQLATSPTVLQTLEQMLVARLGQAASQPQAGGLPQQPIIPAALGQALAQLPGGGAAGARMGLANPQPGVQNGVPGVSNAPGLPAGSAIGVPGGPALANQLRPQGGMPPAPGTGVGFGQQPNFPSGSLDRQSAINAAGR